MELDKKITPRFFKKISENKASRLAAVAVLVIVVGVVLYLAVSQRGTSPQKISPVQVALKDKDGNVLPVKLERSKTVEDTTRFASRDIFQSLLATSAVTISPTQSGGTTVTGGTEKEPQPGPTPTPTPSPDPYTPVISMASPQSNSTISGTATVKATVSDEGKGGSKIASAYYSVGGGSAVSMAAADGKFDSSTEEVVANLDTTKFADGYYELKVTGKDAVGNQGVAKITIRVMNTAPVGWMKLEALSDEYAVIKFDGTGDGSNIKTYELQPGDKFEDYYMLVSINKSLDSIVVWKGDERIELEQGKVYEL